MSGEDDKNYSLHIKIDGVSKTAAMDVVQDVTRSARRNAQGARGTYTVAPTRTLKSASESRLLPAYSPEICGATMRNGLPCTAPALPDNDGFCGRHNRVCQATMRNGLRCTAPPLPGNGGYCGRHSR